MMLARTAEWASLNAPRNKMRTEYFYLGPLPDREQRNVSVCSFTSGDVTSDKTVIENVDDLMCAMSSEL